MKDTKLFIFTFLSTLLIFSAIPLSLYLTSSDIVPYEDLEMALNKFSSYEELVEFLDTTPEVGHYTLGFSDRSETFGGNDMLLSPEEPSPTALSPESESQSVDSDGFSKTNVQVEGVDEADIVKTDGEYIYIVTGNNLTIVKAYPPEEARVVSKINLDGYISGIYINDDKLAIIHNDYQVYPFYDGIGILEDSEIVEPAVPDEAVDDEEGPNETEGDSGRDEPVNVTITEPSPSDPINGTITPPDEPVKPEEPSVPLVPIIWEPPTTSVKVYDISNKANPILTRDFSSDGGYFNSRMIGDYVYFVSTMYTYRVTTDVLLPRIHAGNETEIIPANEIYYSNLSDTSYSFTTIVALNIKDDAQAPTHETIVLGGASSIYASKNNVYLTFYDYSWLEGETTKTTIHRAQINQETITFVAAGEVPGQILNQFSMDEHNGYFRIATTIYGNNWRTFGVLEDGPEPAITFAPEPTQNTNNVYVLDMNLNVVGKVQDLAPGEQIYSTRFMGNRCYMVTFRNIDPLFVIDLSDPTAPTVLGELKVTGYSGYLHPYDENILIGIGKETIYDAEEDFAWYQGIKISLFDVSDVSNPVEVDKIEIGDRGTDSPILYDHKSLLFDKEKNLLVIPISVAEIDPSDYEGEIPDWAYGKTVWQGAYVFDVTENGISIRGRITHSDGSIQPQDTFGFYYGWYNYQVKRSLFIEDVLYTISDMKVKMNNLDTLAEINTVDIS